MFKIFDNLITVDNQLELEQNIVGNSYLPFYYSLDTVGSSMEQNLFDDSNILHQPQFVHMLCSNNKPSSKMFNYILSKIDFKLLGLDEYKFLRVKINLLTPPVRAFKYNYHVPHFDSKNPNDVSIIYYVNDSDGDTVLFNESYDGVVPSKLSIMKTVSPKRGRLVVFNSNQFHSSSPPLEKDFRYVINMVLTLHSQ